MPTETITVAEQRAAVLAEAHRWIGTGFHQGARVLGAGVDCGQLLAAVYGSIGMAVPEGKQAGHFPRDWHLHVDSERYLELFYQYGFKEVATPEPGDVTMFRIGRPFSHSGIVVFWPTIIHAHWHSGVELADATQPPFARRKMKFFRPAIWS